MEAKEGFSFWSLFITPCWSFVFVSVKQWYLYGPRFLGGRENLPLLDICASNLGISSTVLLSKGGEAVCQEQLDNTITGYCTILFTGLCVALVFWMPSIFNLIKKMFEIPKKKKERVESNKSILILAKILQACRQRKTATEKEVWKIFETETNCTILQERTLQYVSSKNNEKKPKLLLLE